MQDASPLPTVAPVAGSYADDDLVYVDPETRTVVGRVEWSNSGRPKSLERPTKQREEEDEEDGKGKRRMRKPRVRYYPWGTYRAMKRLFKIEGKVPEERGNATLDEVLPKALNEAFWD